LIWLLLLSLLLDIGGGFGLKYLVLSFFLFFGMVKLLKEKINRSLFFEISLCVFFSAAALVSVLRGNNIIYAFSEVSFLAFLSLLVVGNRVGADFLESAFLRVSFFAAIIVITTFFVIFFFPRVGIFATSFSIENRLGYIGVKSIGSGVPNVYFRWSIWLLLGFALSLFSKKYFLSAVILAAAVMTLSTAVIGGVVMVMLVYAFIGGGSKYVKLVRISFIPVLIVFGSVLSIYLFPNISAEVLSKLSESSSSSSIKIGHIKSILILLADEPHYLIYGQGPGSWFYSTGAGSLVKDVEVSHFNLLRQFGVFGFALYFFYSFYVIVSLLHLGRRGYAWAVGLTVMFIMAGTNPLLLSPIFFVPLMLGRVYYLESIKAKNHERGQSRGSDVDIQWMSIP